MEPDLQSHRKSDDHTSYSVLRRVDASSVVDIHRWSLGMLSEFNLTDMYTLAHTHVSKHAEQVLILRGLTPIAWMKPITGLRNGQTITRVGLRMNKATITNPESSQLAMAAMSSRRPAIKM